MLRFILRCKRHWEGSGIQLLSARPTYGDTEVKPMPDPAASPTATPREGGIMDRMRCFIAAELPSKVIVALGSLELQLKEGRHRFVTWVQPDNIHITLKFLGSTPVEDLESIIDALTGVSERTQPLVLRLGALGCFPNMQRPEVLWVSLEGEVEKLGALQREVDLAMENLGFPRESRRFVPHLTLARIRRQASLADKQAFGRLVTATTFSSDLPIEVNEISLMESQLTPAGPIYNRLAMAELG